MKNIAVSDCNSAFNWEMLQVSRPMTLHVEADEMSVNELIGLCRSLDFRYEEKAETLGDGKTKVELFFNNLTYTEKTKIMERIKPVLDRGVQFQWIEI